MSVQVSGPSNSVSRLYGSGYDLCGPLAYEIWDSDSVGPVTPGFFSIETVTDLVNGDKVTL